MIVQINSHKMRLYMRNTVRNELRHINGLLEPGAYKPVPLSSQQLYSCEDVQAILERNVPDRMNYSEDDNDVNTVYLRFENEWVGVYSTSELRLAIKLATIYHNNLVSENFQHEKDLTGKHYGETFHTPETTPTKTLVEPMQSGENHLDESASFASCDSNDHTHDPDFEMNEDLVPWKQECGRWYKSLEEKYGFYM